MQDNFSKYLIAIPLRDQTAESVADAVAEHLILIYGIPDKILTDQGAQFMGKVFKNLCKIFKIEQIRTSGYRPQSNGRSERSHRTLEQYLRHYIDLDLNNWDEYVKLACFAYNTSVNSSTSFTLFELIYGKKANAPSSFTKEMNNEKFYGYDDYIKRLINNMRQAYQIARDKLNLS